MPPLRAATIFHSPHTLCDTCPRSGLLPSLTRHYPESRDSAALESSTQGVKAVSRGPLVCAHFFQERQIGGNFPQRSRQVQRVGASARTRAQMRSVPASQSSSQSWSCRYLQSPIPLPPCNGL